MVESIYCPECKADKLLVKIITLKGGKVFRVLICGHIISKGENT